MSSMHFIGGEKGGIGKSVMARLLTQFFIDNQLPVVGFDTDKSHSSYTRFYSDFVAPVALNDFESLDSILQVFEENEDANIVIDLAAQSHQPLSAWIVESDLFEAAQELGIDVYLWHVMDDGKESVQLLNGLLQTYGTAPKYILVQNEGRGSNFSLFDNSEEKKKALSVGATLINLPKLHQATMQKIDRLDSSFWAAINITDKHNKVLGLLERNRAKNWLKKSSEAIASVVVIDSPDELQD
nr:hypothetical protein [uncultured Desulfobulbus sp.]